MLKCNEELCTDYGELFSWKAIFEPLKFIMAVVGLLVVIVLVWNRPVMLFTALEGIC